MLRWRLISSTVIISVLLGLVWLDSSMNFGHPGVWLIPVLLAVAWLAVGELLSLTSRPHSSALGWTTFVGTNFVVLAACAPVLWREYPADCPLGKLGWPLAGLAAGVGLAFIGEMRRFKQTGNAVLNIALSVFVMTYVGIPLSFLAALRMFRSDDWGMAAVLSVIIIVKVSDAGAYACGRTLGRHQLSPSLSPGKTIEGAIGGIITGCLASWLVFQFLVPAMVGPTAARTALWESLAYGTIVVVAGMLGDLAESLLKRDSGRKDSSRWMPGLGGVLDIVDSLFAAAPAAFLCWAAGLV